MSAGIKIPWANVAEIMGDKISEGAIVQHLAKLRNRMEAEGFVIPPELRRGPPAAGRKSTSSNTKAAKAQGPARATHGMYAPSYKRPDSRENTATDGWSTTTANFDNSESRLSFPAFETRSETSSISDIAGQNESQASLVVALRISPTLLGRFIHGYKDNCERFVLKREPEASLEDCTMDENHEIHAEKTHAERSNNSNMQRNAYATDAHALTQIGAQHYHASPQWTGADFASLAALADAALPDMTFPEYDQFPAEQSTQPLQSSDQLLHQYSQEAFDEEMRRLPEYLTAQSDEFFGMNDDSGTGSSQDDLFGWLDMPLEDSGSQDLESSFAMDAFISSEYLNE